MSAMKPLRRQIPKQMSFVAVEWGVQAAVSRSDSASGLAHVLQSDGLLAGFGASPLDFAVDAVGSALGEEMSQRARSKQAPLPVDNARRMESFVSDWQVFDWTSYI